MNPVPDFNKTKAMAAIGGTRAAAAPRMELSSDRGSIDYPDSALGEALMAGALEGADLDAMYGIPRTIPPRSPPRPLSACGPSSLVLAACFRLKTRHSTPA